MSNTGSCNWEQGTALVFDSGFKMSAPDTRQFALTAPGGTADIGVTMFAPANPGTYEGVWQLRSPQGEFHREPRHRRHRRPEPQSAGATADSNTSPAATQPTLHQFLGGHGPGQRRTVRPTSIGRTQRPAPCNLQYIGHSDGVTGQGDRWVCPSTRQTLHPGCVPGGRQPDDPRAADQYQSRWPDAPQPHRITRTDTSTCQVNPQQIKKGDCSTVTWDVGELHKIFFDNHKFTSHQGSYNWCPKESTRTNSRSVTKAVVAIAKTYR